ncbi:hypothetical protein [Paenibacillus pinihumi]|uniref:hypothetical protein n=1 Tax=Paenibacillus pinihumi TaxID=669462 RepID=UPI000402FA01|nr:hypothetical protein [Paenibacillus pinihumi]
MPKYSVTNPFYLSGVLKEAGEELELTKAFAETLSKKNIILEIEAEKTENPGKKKGGKAGEVNAETQTSDSASGGAGDIQPGAEATQV